MLVVRAFEYSYCWMCSPYETNRSESHENSEEVKLYITIMRCRVGSSSKNTPEKHNQRTE